MDAPKVVCRDRCRTCGPALDFARAIDADPAAHTTYHCLSYSRKREHVPAIESAKAKTHVRRIERARDALTADGHRRP